MIRLAFLIVLGLAGAAEAAGPSAMVIVVNDTGGRGDWRKKEPGSVDRVFARALDQLGEPAMATVLEQIAREKYDEVVVLQDAEATFTRFAAHLRELDRRGFTIDALIDVHGCGITNDGLGNPKYDQDLLCFPGGDVTPEQVRALGRPRPLRLNAVYMTSCWGSRFNEAWLEAGARAANGSRELDYYVVLSPVYFLRRFVGGDDLETAAQRAYAAERALLGGSAFDRLWGRLYAGGKRAIDGAKSSERLHAGAKVKSAAIAARTAPARPTRAKLF